MRVESLIATIDWDWINALTSENIETLYYKSDTDWTTEIDLAIEKHLMTAISRFDPEAPIVSEEDFEAHPVSLSPEGILHKWYVDPIDGTYNMTLGLPYFGLQLACWDLKVNQPILGLIYIPRFGELISWDNTMGKGLFQIWDPIEKSFVSKSNPVLGNPHPLSKALLCFGDFSSSNKASRPFQGQLIQRLSLVAGKIRLHGSSSLDFHLLCTGKTQAYILFTKRVWEIYPGLALAKGFGLTYECLQVNSADYQGPVWLIAQAEIFIELKNIILAI